jgi:hypothetical protein
MPASPAIVTEYTTGFDPAAPRKSDFTPGRGQNCVPISENNRFHRATDGVAYYADVGAHNQSLFEM